MFFSTLKDMTFYVFNMRKRKNANVYFTVLLTLILMFNYVLSDELLSNSRQRKTDAIVPVWRTQSKNCSENEFRCKYSQKCIKKEYVCDSVIDCGLVGNFNLLDDSDENQNCTKSCEKNEELCSNGECLAIEKFCNGIRECSNDEVNCKDQTPCQQLKCDYDCKITPQGPKCYCPSGQQVINDTKCVDLDECQMKKEICDQNCENLINTYKCSCVAGYERINKRCIGINNPVEDPTQLFLIASDELVSFRLPKKHYQENDDSIKTTVIQRTYVNDSIDMTINFENKTVCILKLGEIDCFDAFDFEKKWKLPPPNIFQDLDYVTQFEFDWISKNWYFMDTLHNVIFICSEKIEYCRILVENGSKTFNYRRFAIDPNEGFLFVTKYGMDESSGSIIRYTLDGKNSKFLIDKKIFFPNYIALDQAKKLVFYLDNFYSFIQQCDYDGNNRKFLPHVRFFAINFFENYFYNILEKDFSLIQIDKTSEFEKKILIDEIKSNAKLLKIYHRQIQPVRNIACLENECNHICIAISNQSSCICNDGFEMNQDKKCVQTVPSKFLIYLKEEPLMIKATSIDTEKTERKSILTPVSQKEIRLGDVNIEDELIYFSTQNSESKKYSIESQMFNGTKRTILLDNLNSVESLAYDSFGKNIYFISDFETEFRIVAFKANADISNSSLIKTLVKHYLSLPKNIILDEEKGMMYWSSYANKYSIGGSIDSAWMDGTNRRTIIKMNDKTNPIYWPTSLTLDKNNNKLYWLDLLTRSVEYVDLSDTTKRDKLTAITAVSFHPSSIAILDGKIYWSDHIKSTIEMLNLDTSTNRNSTIFVVEPAKIRQIKAIEYSSQALNAKRNNSCPGLWLINPTQNPFCVCQDNFSLNAAGTHCFPSANNKNDTKTSISCEAGQFQCSAGNECIKSEKFCNGVRDCIDGSDESADNCLKRCDFRCDEQTRCLSKSAICNQEVDCVDESDESAELCHNITSICEEGNCDSGHTDYCDEFICANGNCVEYLLTCDSEDNCGDNSDEINCPNSTSPGTFPDSDTKIDKSEDFNYEYGVNDDDCQYPNFYCIQTKKCISHHMLCDGKKDCIDGSDEDGRCEEKLCDHITDCQYFCHNAPHDEGYVCYCPSHLFLELNKKNCGSPQECDNFSSCSHICENINSTNIKCSCLHSYRLESDNFTCVERNAQDPIILYSNRFVIKGVNANSLSVRNYYSLSKNVIGLDFFYDILNKHYEIYWSDVNEDKIFMGIVKNGELLNVKPIVESGLSTTEAVAVDWIGENIYWVDSSLRQIEVAKKNGSYRRTLISEDMSNPRSIALDPRVGYLFWSDWDAGNPRIERSTLSGDDRKPIFLIKNLKGSWPNGITLDYVKNRIFFLDAKSKEIHTIDYDGQDDRRILKNAEYLSHPYAISIYENVMYWTDWRISGVLRADKFTGTNITMISHAISQAFDIKIMHPSRQPKSDGISKVKKNPCSADLKNGGCSHLCLLSTNNTFKCDCPHMMRLSDDKKTCEYIDDMLLFISGSDEIKGVDLIRPNTYTISTIKHATEMITPTHLDYDPMNNRIYWTDIQLNMVKAVQLSTISKPSHQKIETIIDSSFENVIGFSIDWISELLYYVQLKPEKTVEDNNNNKYKSCRVMISNLNGEYLSILMDDLNEIYSFLVSPHMSKIYFAILTDYEGAQNFSIKQSNLDGSDLEILITEDEYVHSLSLNVESKRLYFIKNYQKLFYYDFETRKTELVNTFYGKDDKYSNLSISCLVNYRDKIYYGENYTNTIQTCKNQLCRTPQIFRNNTSNIKQMKIVPLSTDIASKINKCKTNPCSQLCIPTPSKEEGFICACALGYKISLKNPYKCVGYDDFLLYSVGHEIQGISLTDSNSSSELLTPMQKIHEITSIDFDAKNDYFYIADGENGEILRIKKDGSGRTSILTSIDNLENNHRDWLSDLAVDWLAGNLYWTDQRRGLIEVSRVNGDFRYVITSQINRPNLISLDPVVGVLFFVDGDYKIIRQNLDGGNFKFHVNKFIESYQIYHMVLDTTNQLVYWCEAKTNKIWKIDYDGNERKPLEIDGAVNPISMDIFNNRMYWAEKGSGIIKSVDLKKLNETTILQKTDESNIKHIKVFSASKQHGTNNCAMPIYGNCEELCLFNGTHGVCHCSQGRVDPINGKNCNNYTNFLFYSRMDTIEKLLVSNTENSANNLNISSKGSLKNIIALTYDYDEKLIYFSDIQLNTIYSCDFQGNSLKKVVENQTTVEGIGFHPQTKELFWTVGNFAEIRSVKLNQNSMENASTANVTQSIKILLKLKRNEDKLRALAIEPCLNMFYFSNWNVKKPSIQRAYVTGYGRENVITTDIMMPNAITFDFEEKKLFWADARLDKIEYCNYDGTGRYILAHSSPKHPFSIAVFGEFIFWTDWVLHGILKTNKYSANDVTFLRRNIQRPMGIIVVQELPHDCTSNRCNLFNGGCEDICLPHGLDGIKCECSQGTLDKTGKRCIDRKKEVECNVITEYECKSGECVPLLVTCDNIKHCSDYSDEDLNYCATRNCTSDTYFQCRNFRCIERKLLCNSRHECGDGSDEENCECKGDEFRCGSGECIAKNLRCDYDPDCRDFSDEMNCPKRNCNLDKTLSYGLYHVSNKTSNFNFEQCPYTTACILSSWICDGENDCWDNWDEKNCTDVNAAKNQTCDDNQYQCLNGNCIPIEWLCDEEQDCNDGIAFENGTFSVSSDEQNCKTFCKKNQFKCANSSMCIPMAFVCDNLFDCPDKSDEEGDCQSKPYDVIDESVDDCAEDDESCNTSQYNVDNNKNCPEGHFICDNRDCIDLGLICDTKSDCEDGSDETFELCKDNASYCEKNPKKFRCKGGSCIDMALVCDQKNDCGDFSDEEQCNINECEFAGECEHICEDLKIGYKCSCHPGFKLNDKNKCEDIDECLTRSCSQICLNTFGSYKCECYDGFIKTNGTCKADTPEKAKILFSNRYYIRAVDFQGNTELLIHNLSNAVALDFDWNKRFVYYSDVTSVKSEIARIKLDDKLSTTYEKEVLHHQNLKNPDGLAFDWIAKNIYFADKGRHTIEVSADSGRYRKTLLNNKLDEPRAIVLDPFGRSMFWSDWGKEPHIGKAGMDGSNPRYIVNDKNLGWPNALTISFETNELYYGDAREDFIAVCDLNGNNKKIITSRAMNPSLNLHHIFAIAVWEDRIFWSDWELKSIEYCDKYTAKSCGTLVQTIHRPMDIRLYHSLRQTKLQIPFKKKMSDVKKSDPNNKKKTDLTSYTNENPCFNNTCPALCLLMPEPPYYKCACPDNFISSEDGTTCRANCTATQFLCQKSLKCIPFYFECDGMPDCVAEDGTIEDETEACPKDRQCQPGYFQCNSTSGDNATCLRPHLICDGIKQCEDGDDEKICDDYDCVIDTQFKCEKTENSSAFCIDASKRCNNQLDCPNGNDEKDCPAKSCSLNQFKCKSDGSCVANVWMCDGDIDCADGSDESEENCSNRMCGANEFRCLSGRCIPLSWKCDGENDCGASGEDEGVKGNCDAVATSCEPSYFRCNNSKCIPGRWQCDYERDCDDGSDEIGCKARNCSESEFRCDDGRCIRGALRCNGEYNCKDFSDEFNCTVKCDENSFKCENQNVCINKKFLCDGDGDCADFSDEKNCGCNANEFKCGGAIEKCILTEFLCDGIVDCPGGSDEYDSRCLSRSCSGNAVKCNNGKCIPRWHLCNNEDNCGDGFDELKCDVHKKPKPSNNLKNTCKFSNCSQICLEKNKVITHSFQCKCSAGYHKSNTPKSAPCRAITGQPIIFSASEADFRFLIELERSAKELDSKESEMIKIYSYIQTPSLKITSFDYVIDDENLSFFWLESMPSNNLYTVNVSAKLDLSNLKDEGFQLKDVNVVGKNKPKENIYKSLALDWINNKIYLIENDMIKALNFDGSGKKTILDGGRNSWDLVLDPISRQVIWSTMLRIIYIASMDGSNKRVLINENVEFASGLAIDQPTRRLYWADIRKSTIETTLLDGSDRHIIRQYKSLDLYGLPIGPFKLDVFEDELFVVFSNQTIHKINKFGNIEVDEEIFHGVYLHKSSHLKVVHPLLRNTGNNNPCLKNPCDPSAICLLSTNQNQRTCTCADEMLDVRKNNDKITCVEKYNVPGTCMKHCYNGGKCQYINEKQTCVCLPKYDGGQCEHFICSGYCTNDGICLLPPDRILFNMTSEEAKNQRRCKCKSEWTGETCSIPMKLCQNECHNGGTCHYITLNNGTIKEQCTCPLNFSGSKCESCASLQCFNGGICRESALSMYICDCNDRFTGRHCEIDKCENYCKNNGVCLIDQVKGPTCKCINDYSGERCDQDNQCKDFCMNGGTCMRFGKNTTVCRCSDQFTGNRCEKLNCQYYPNSEDCVSTHSPIDLCAMQIQCENNGICKVNSNGDATCVCVGEWTGSNCNIPPPCINDECGNCNEQSSINECTCKNGLVQPCLISGNYPHDGYVSSTEIVTTSHEKIPYIMILVFILCFLSTLVFVTGVYMKRWLQRNRFFTHSRLLNETNVEEITNPIFEYSAAETEEAPGAPLQNFGNDAKINFSNPIYESMYSSFSNSNRLLDRTDDEDEIKNDLL